MDNKIKHNGRLLPLSWLPFTNEDKKLIYEDLVKGMTIEELGKKYKFSNHGMRRYSLMLMREKESIYNPPDKNVYSNKKFNIYDELYPQYEWKELTPYEVRFYEEYEKGRILRKSNLIYLTK